MANDYGMPKEDMIRALVDSGKDLDINYELPPANETALITLIRTRYPGAISALLESDALDPKSGSPLMTAVQMGRNWYDIVDLLATHPKTRDQVYLEDEYGNSPMSYTIETCSYGTLKVLVNAAATETD